MSGEVLGNRLGLLRGARRRTVVVTAVTAAMAVMVFALAASPTLAQCTITAGSDLFITPAPPGGGPGPTYDDLSEDPIPLGFFGPGSDPFDGIIYLKGSPFPVPSPHGWDWYVDTIVERRTAASLSDPYGGEDTVDTQIIALNLVSTMPITVTFDGDPSQTADYDVQVCLSTNGGGPLPSLQPLGSMTIRHRCPNGGQFDSVTPVVPRLMFSKVSGVPQAVSSAGLDPAPQLDFTVTNGCWSHTDPGFASGWLFLTIGGFADHDCDGTSDVDFPASTTTPYGFFPGVCWLPCDGSTNGTGEEPAPRKRLTPEQQRMAEHGILPGEEEDEDEDADGVHHTADNCPGVPNPDQADTDECVGGGSDGLPCDSHDDCTGGYCTGDTVGDMCDNCPDDYNPFQEDGDGDTIGDVCDATTPCEKCGPGAHWVDTCTGGLDLMDGTGALVGLDLDLDCVVDTTLDLSGATTVRRLDPSDDSAYYPGLRVVDDHLDVIDTEIVEMDLTGAGVTLTAGGGGGSGGSLPPSYGAIAEDESIEEWAQSFFDVYFEVDLGDGTYYYNYDPLQVEVDIDCVPPEVTYVFEGCLALYDSPQGGTQVANAVAVDHETFRPPPGPEPKWTQRPHEPGEGFDVASDLWWNDPGTAIKRAQPAATPAPPRVPSEPQMTNMGEEAVPVFAGHVLTVTGDRGTGILYAPSQPDDPTFRAAVSAISGEPCDYFDARIATPTVAQMLPYSCVFTWINYACADPVQFGDNLADYVDAGGRVILGNWCYHTTQANYLQGRIMTPAYCPITAGGWGTSTTYAGDGVTCIHDGVIAYSTTYRDSCILVPGALSDGTFTDGWLSVGYWPDYSVFYSAGNMGWDGGTGDWDRLVANMCACEEVNKVVSDDFISDGRPIMTVRWWGSHLDPIYEPEQAAEPYTIDGWFISFHQGDPAITYPGCPPDAEAGDDPTVLGLYFAPVDAVQIVNLGYQDCLDHTVYEYLVDLEQCCLLCSEVDPRTGATPADTDAFHEEAELHYWLGIQAVVGVTWVPPCCCSYDDQTLTGHLPSDHTTNGHFWGWHTSPAQDMRNEPLWGACTGRIMNPGPYTPDDCWDYHNWDVPLWECPAGPPNQIDMAFELVAPPWPVFDAVSSCHYHCKPRPCATGELCLDIGLGTQAWNDAGAIKDPNLEPRLGGAKKLKLQMSQDMDPNTVHGGNVQVDCYVSGPYGGTISAMPGATASEVVLLFSGGLPEQDCCRIDLAGMTSTVGDAVTDAYFISCLEGDVNRDFAVSSTDASSVKQRLQDEVTDANQQYDVNADRMMSTTDRSSIKQRLGRLMPQCP